MMCIGGCRAAPDEVEMQPDIYIAVTPPALEMSVNDTFRFTALLAGRLAAGGVSWRSTNALVAVVAPTGTVRAVRAGTATIIATARADTLFSAAAVVTAR